MINDYPEGGLRMIDIASFNKALKSTWIKKYLNEENNSAWKIFFHIELEKCGGKLFLLGTWTRKTPLF